MAWGSSFGPGLGQDFGNNAGGSNFLQDHSDTISYQFINNDFRDYADYRVYLVNQKAYWQGKMNSGKVLAVQTAINGWDSLASKDFTAAKGRAPSGIKEISDFYPKPFNPAKLYHGATGGLVAFHKLVDKIGDGVEHLAKEYWEIQKKLIAKIGQAGAAVILAPYKGAMKRALDKRHIPHGNDIIDIATKFYDHVVKHGEAMFEYMDPATAGMINEEAKKSGIDIKAIIKAITAFFKTLSGSVKEAEDKANAVGKDVNQIAQDLGISPEALDLAKLINHNGDKAETLIKLEAGSLENSYNRTQDGASTPKGNSSPNLGKIIFVGLIVFGAIKYGPRLLKSGTA